MFHAATPHMAAYGGLVTSELANRLTAGVILRELFHSIQVRISERYEFATPTAEVPPTQNFVGFHVGVPFCLIGDVIDILL
mgnify:CR=1 FL=1